MIHIRLLPYYDTCYYFTVTESIISAPFQENNAMVQTLSPRDMEILKKMENSDRINRIDKIRSNPVNLVNLVNPVKKLD